MVGTRLPADSLPGRAKQDFTSFMRNKKVCIYLFVKAQKDCDTGS